MKKRMAIGSVFAVSLGLAACSAPADYEGEAEEVVEAVEETAADAEAAVEGEMTGDADAAEGEGEGGESTGPDQDGNPIED